MSKIKERSQSHQELELYLQKIKLDNQNQVVGKINQIRILMKEHFQSIRTVKVPVLGEMRSLKQKNKHCECNVDFELKMQETRDRLKRYKSWEMKLKVARCFVHQKKETYMKQFQRITEITTIQDPNDYEAMNNLFELTKALEKQKLSKESTRASLMA